LPTNFLNKCIYLFFFLPPLFLISFASEDKLENSNNNFLAQIDWDIEKNKINRHKIIWEIENEDFFNKKYKLDSENNRSNKVYEQINYRNPQFNFLDYGQSTPSANTLPGAEFRIQIGQVSTFQGGDYSGGTGNQNYFSKILYGINNNTNFSIFYTEADDPLYKRISSKPINPSNLYTNFGFSLRRNLFNLKNSSIALDTSYERWRFKSGGCNGFGCNTNSNNIFNQDYGVIDNTNSLISISLPFTTKFDNNLELTISPRYIFLPKYQNGYDFFGQNLGIGLGGKYSFNKKFRLFGSSYIPIGSGYNSFNSDLIYSKKLINTLGISYSFDQRTALEGFITNSFGATPATSILTLPSSNEVLYGARLIYTPSILEKNNLGKANLSESHSKTSNVERKSFNYVFFNDRSNFYKLNLGLSEAFTLDISSEIIDEKITKDNQFVNTYIEPGTRSLRVGGAIKVFSPQPKNNISSAFRFSFGRTMGNVRNGYLFGELINKIILNKRFSIKINPKFSNTGTGNLYSLGSSVNLKLNNRLEIIPESNFSIKNSENNLSLTARTFLKENIFIDIFSTNSLGVSDMSKQFKNESTKYGAKLTLKF